MNRFICARAVLQHTLILSPTHLFCHAAPCCCVSHWCMWFSTSSFQDQAKDGRSPMTTEVTSPVTMAATEGEGIMEGVAMVPRGLGMVEGVMHSKRKHSLRVLSNHGKL